MRGWHLSHNLTLAALTAAAILCAPGLAIAGDKLATASTGSISILDNAPVNLSWTNADTVDSHKTFVMPSAAFTMKDLPGVVRELDDSSPMIAPLRVTNDDLLIRRPNIQDPNLGIRAVDQQLATMGPRQANTFPVMAALTMLGAALKVTGTSGLTVNLDPKLH
jgi:hypothetical protein